MSAVGAVEQIQAPTPTFAQRMEGRSRHEHVVGPGPTCDSQWGGFYCTRIPGHDKGLHEAGVEGDALRPRIVAVWS